MDDSISQTSNTLLSLDTIISILLGIIAIVWHVINEFRRKKDRRVSVFDAEVKPTVLELIDQLNGMHSDISALKAINSSSMLDALNDLHKKLQTQTLKLYEDTYNKFIGRYDGWKKQFKCKCCLPEDSTKSLLEEVLENGYKLNALKDTFKEMTIDQIQTSIESLLSPLIETRAKINEFVSNIESQ